MKKKVLIFLPLLTIILGIISFCWNDLEYKVTIDLKNEAYSYLPDSAKEYVLKQAESGKKVLTEKNKKNGQLYLNPKYVDYLAMSPADQKRVEVIPETYTWDYTYDNNISTSTSSYYNLADDNYVTKIKNQSTLGLCWAFATYSSIETNILVSQLETTQVNFAERQIDYLISDNSIKEVKNPYSITNHELGSGGNFNLASTYLNSGVAPIEENIWGNYDTSSNQRNLSEVINSENVAYQVTGYNIYGSANYEDNITQEQYRAVLKDHIKNYGSLYVSALSPAVDQAGTCYNYELNMINETEDCNKGYNYHAMSIIGWNDDYAGVGAWILKNSWGSYVPYTYLAYSSLYYDVNGVTEVKYRNWDNIYDYTKSGSIVTNRNSIEVTYDKAKDFSEKMVRVNFTHESINGKYEVYVKNSSTSGYQLIKTVTTNYPGLATVDIDDIELNDSEFSIKVVSLNGIIGTELNAFTTNNSETIYTEESEFTYTGSNFEHQFIYRNISSGTKLPLYLFNKYGERSLMVDNYVINGTSNSIIKFPSTFQKENYFLTFNENFFEVELDGELVELDINELPSYQLSYVIDSKLTITSLEFKSSNSSIATVSNTGLIEAVHIGNATITMIVNDVIERSIPIIVGPIVTVGLVDIIEETQTIYRNVFNELQLNFEVSPVGSAISNLSWSSSNPSIATVDQNGVVKALKAGNVTITIEVDNCRDQIDLVIKDTNAGLTLDKSQVTLYKNGENTVAITPTLKNFMRVPKYTWSSSDSSVATVDNGVITGIGNGVARIVVTALRERYAAGVLVYVIDDSVYFDLEIDPNKGTYNDLNEFKYTKNSLEVVAIANPVYATEVEFVYNVLNKENMKTPIQHTFLKWILTGSGSLADSNYTFGFKNSKLTATWQMTSLTLPDISSFDSTKNFIGWYSDADLTNFVGKDIQYIPTNNITLYAKWSSIKLADVNADEEVDITDLVILRRHLAGIEILNDQNLLAADLNKDKEVDITDLVILRRFLAGLEELN